MGMSAQDIPDLIDWHEGLLLTPQHFQELTLRHEALLHYSAAAIAPFYWGVRSFRVDPDSLTTEMLKISALEAVMPDSLVVSLAKSRKLTLDLKDYKLQEGPLTIYLAVAGRENNFATKGDNARYYSSLGDSPVDESTRDGHPIARLAPSLSLRTKDKLLSTHVSFPLLQVIPSNGVFDFDPDFIPPTLSVTAHSPLGKLCSGVAERVRKKATLLSEQSSSPSLRAEMKLDLETRSRIRSLVAGLPYLEVLLETGVSHPFQVYLALCSMVGQLSVFSPRLVPPVLPKYDHDNLRVTFDKVIFHINLMLKEEETASAYKVYLFQYRDGIYELPFDGDWMDKRLFLGIRGETGMSEREVVNWGNECLIGSKDKLRNMRETRTLGAGRKQIVEAEELVPPRGAVLFSLKADPKIIEPDEPLQIFNQSARTGAARPSEIVLYVKNKPRNP